LKLTCRLASRGLGQRSKPWSAEAKSFVRRVKSEARRRVVTTSDLCAGKTLAADLQHRFTVAAEHGPDVMAATHGGKGPARGWGTAGERGRGVAGGGVDRRSD
jgi:hypothetical protein